MFQAKDSQYELRCANNFIVIRCKYNILYLNTISKAIREWNLLPKEKCKQFGYILKHYENYAYRTLCLKLDIYTSCNYTVYMRCNVLFTFYCSI